MPAPDDFPAALVRAALIIALLLVGVPAPDGAAQAAKAAERHGLALRLNVSGSHEGAPAFDVAIHLEGVVMAADRRVVADVLEDGTFLIEERRFAADPETPAPVTHRLRILRDADGTLQYIYHVDGTRRPWNDEGRAWLDGVLRRYVR